MSHYVDKVVRGREVEGRWEEGGWVGVIDFAYFLLFQCDHLVYHENP